MRGKPVDSDEGVLVIGLGNPILGDDGVGWKVAQQVALAMPPDSTVETDCVSIGGLGLMERMLGFRHVILVDAMESGAAPEGTVRTFPLSEMGNPQLGHSASAHDTTLATALATARIMGAPIPERVDVVAIEARHCREFSEELSPAVNAGVQNAVASVLELLPK